MTAATTERETRSRVAATILVVDDDPDILDFVTLALEFKGFTTKAARDGAEALGILEAERPGLVLLDMRMPVLDGWSFARALAEREIDVPVIVMTAAQNARRWAEEINADAYLEKPFDIDELLGAVARVLSA